MRFIKTEFIYKLSFSVIQRLYQLEPMFLHHYTQ